MKLNGLEKFFKTNEDGFIVDFKQVYRDDYTPLMFAFLFNKFNYLNLNNKQFDFLIKNSDFKQVNKYDKNALFFALRYNKSNKLKLTLSQFEYMINNSDLNLIYNCEDKYIIQEFKNIQSEINNKNLLNKINNNKEVIKKTKI